MTRFSSKFTVYVFASAPIADNLTPALSDDLNIESEEKENIKNFLWKKFGKEVLKEASRGFPEFYKNYLLQGMSETENEKI